MLVTLLEYDFNQNWPQPTPPGNRPTPAAGHAYGGQFLQKHTWHMGVAWISFTFYTLRSLWEPLSRFWRT